MLFVNVSLEWTLTTCLLRECSKKVTQLPASHPAKLRPRVSHLPNVPTHCFHQTWQCCDSFNNKIHPPYPRNRPVRWAHSLKDTTCWNSHEQKQATRNPASASKIEMNPSGPHMGCQQCSFLVLIKNTFPKKCLTHLLNGGKLLNSPPPRAQEYGRHVLLSSPFQ